MWLFKELPFLTQFLEEYAANKKKDVFEKSFKKKVTVTWKQIQPLQQQPAQQPQIEEPKSSSQSTEIQPT